MPDISGIAIEAARAMDVGHYSKVRRLFDGLVDDGVPEEDVRQAFQREGANIDNLPTQYSGGSYMLRETKGTQFDQPPLHAHSI